MVASVCLEAAGKEWFSTTYMVKDDGPVRSVKELIAHAKAKGDVWFGTHEAAARWVAGHDEVLRLESLPSLDRHGARHQRESPLERLNGPFRMIPSRRGLLDGRRALGEEAGQQHAALDLCARHLRRMCNPAQCRAVHGEGSTPLVRVDTGAHGAQRGDDAPHRAATQGGVPGERGRERVAGGHAGQQAHRRAGVLAVEGGRRLRKLSARDRHEVRRPVDGGAEGADAGQGGTAIEPGGVAADGRRALGQRRQHGIAMRDRLVPWQGDAAGRAARRHDRRRRGGGRGHQSTIAFAFLTEFGLVLLFKPVQPEAVLSFTIQVSHHVRVGGGMC